MKPKPIIGMAHLIACETNCRAVGGSGVASAAAVSAPFLDCVVKCL